MPRLMKGALTIDLVDSSIHGDIDHCPKEDLLESARALLACLPQLRHKGLWGLGKDYAVGCWVHTTVRRYSPKAIAIEAGFEWHRTASIGVAVSSRDTYWKFNWYFKPVGKVVDGQVVDDAEGVESHCRPREPRNVTPTPVLPTRSRVAKGKEKPKPKEMTQGKLF